MVTIADGSRPARSQCTGITTHDSLVELLAAANLALPPYTPVGHPSVVLGQNST